MLNKFERYLKENIERLANTGYTDENPRGKYKSDGSPAHSLITRGSVFETFDINAGEIPITETRPIPYKTGINEMLAFFQSQTNTISGFKSHNCDWWSEWSNKEGNIGRAYAYNLESHRPNEMNKEVVSIKNKILDEDSYTIEEVITDNELLPSIDGKIYKSNYRNYGEYIITNEYQENNRVMVDVQFLNTLYITSVRLDSLKRGQHPKNNFTRTVNGVGYLGRFKEVNNFTNYELTTLKNIWTRMIKRCYDGTRPEYDDVYVHKRWHSFENFLRDIRMIPQYHLAKENGFKGYHLDKDYYGSNVYSKDTCVFLSTSENTIYRRNQSCPIKVHTSNSTVTYLTHTSMAKVYGVSISTVGRWVRKGYMNTEKGLVKIEELPHIEGYNYRLELSRNQLNELLNSLSINPYGKRHIMSFFHWSNMNKKNLVECAYETLWTVSNVGEERFLDLTLVQRSSDALVAGTGINSLQYVALQMAVAKHLGIKPGLFEHLRKNYHIYGRHVENLEITYNRLVELSKRTEPSNIEFKLNVPDGTNFYDIKASDYELIGYNPIKPQLKFDLAI